MLLCAINIAISHRTAAPASPSSRYRNLYGIHARKWDERHLRFFDPVTPGDFCGCESGRLQSTLIILGGSKHYVDRYLEWTSILAADYARQIAKSRHAIWSPLERGTARSGL